ncbi:MAG TPA: alginate export family protein, partial [Sphingobium sp.]|nr:alginate export family protein [Sphingobium sp.]
IGGRLISDPQQGRWDFEAEGFYQFGDIRASVAPSAAHLPVSASFFHLDAGYSFPGPTRLRLSVEYDQASGDGRGRKFTRFDTLFGMRRADLAPAGIYNAIGRANIRTPGLRAEIAPGNRFDAFAVYRAMWLANRTDAFSTTGVRDAAGRSGSFAGHQIEARMRYWLIPKLLRGEVNALWLAKGRFLETAPNAPATGNAHYFATALTATF